MLIQTPHQSPSAMQTQYIVQIVRSARSFGLGSNFSPDQQFGRGGSTSGIRQSDASEYRELTDEEVSAVIDASSKALVEVIITYGTMCSAGNHGEQIFHSLRSGLERHFGPKVFVLAREDNTTYNCISVHVNNVLVFGSQARRPTNDQLIEQVLRAIDGKRPQLIPYGSAVTCDFYGCTQKHKYFI